MHAWVSGVYNEIKALNSYTEYSPSGTGCHAFVKGNLTGKGRKRKQPDGTDREMYSKGRFFTVTGDKIGELPATINEAQDAVNKLYEKWFSDKTNVENTTTGEKQQKVTKIKLSDSQIIEKLRRASNSEKFNRLYNGDIDGYPSQSEADLALCSLVAFYTQDEEQIFRIIKRSSLYRGKWETQDYRNRTIKEALSGLTETYDPEKADKEKLNTGGMGVLYSQLADIFIKEYHAKTLDGGDLRIYDNGIYPEIRNKYALNNRVLDIASKHGVILTPSQITATIEMIKTKTPYTPPDEDLNKIALSNGVLDVITEKFVPPSPDNVFLNKLPVKYDPNAPSPDMFLQALDRTFKGVEHQIPTLQEIFGYCLYRRYSIAAVFFFLGDGDNGKSVILSLLSAMLGDENTSSLTLSDLANPKNEHVLIDLRGRYANICGDVGKKKIDDTAFLKMMTGKDKIRARGLYKDAITFVNHGKAIFALNFLPEVDDFTDGFKRRIKIIEFPNKFTDKEKIADLEEKIIKAGELSGILNWALEGLKRLLTNNKFSNEKTVAESGLEYDMKSNPISYFVRACIDERPGNIESTEEIISAYMQYRKKYQLPVLSKRDFKNKFINACKEVGITTYEKRHRPAGGNNTDRYYGFANVIINKDDLKTFLRGLYEEPKIKNTDQGNESLLVKGESGQATLKTTSTGLQPSKLFYTSLREFLNEYGEKAFQDPHSAAVTFCKNKGSSFESRYGFDFIENEIRISDKALTDTQKKAS